MSQIILYTSVPVLTMVIGGIIAAIRPPSRRVASGLQHFAAGVVFAVVAAELIPDIKSEHAPWETAISFSLGVFAMLLLSVMSKRMEEGASKGSGLPWGLLMAVGLDVLIDGIVLGIGFAGGGNVGLLLSVALGVELLSLGLATAAEIVGQSGRSRPATIMAIVALAVVFAVGAIAGSAALRGVSNEWLAMLLSFGCAALLYLVTEELLVEAHEGSESPVITSMFFVGFLAIFLLDIVQGGT